METVTYGGKTTTYTYDENGRRKSISYNGGVTENYTYDKDNQLKHLANKKPNGVIISEYKYTYDLTGRQLSKTDSYGTTNYDYDKVGRITKVTTPGKTTVYAYDKAGNRVSLNETYTSLQPSEYIDEATGKDIQYILKKSDYTYSSSNTLLKLVERIFDQNNKELARKTTKYVYDDNGNQIRQSASHILPDDTKLRPATVGTAYGDNVSGDINKLVEKTSYTYDGFNRLKKTENVKEGLRSIAEYTYNGDDLRVSKTVKKSDKGYIAEVTNYLYDRQNVILETDAAESVKARYIKGINYIAKADAQNNTAYFLFNGHGDVVQTVDEAGTPQNQYDYDIWGNPTLTIETTENAIRYSGEFMDSETGLYYLRARYYDTNIGRFISEDSYWGEDENPLSLNLYTYCHNEPVMFTDPTGHSEKGDKNLDKADQKRLIKLGQDYAAAQKKGNTAAMDAAHRAAAAIRDSAYDGKYVDTYKYHTKEPNQNPNGCYGIGSSGDTVEKIQTALVDNGYSVGGIDKTFGRDTKAAVIRFQMDEGLKYDGVVGEKTAKSLGIKLGIENITTSKGNSDSSNSNDSNDDKITLYDRYGSPKQIPNNPTLIANLTNNGYTTYAPAISNSNNSIKINFGSKVELTKTQVQTTNGSAITLSDGSIISKDAPTLEQLAIDFKNADDPFSKVYIFGEFFVEDWKQRLQGYSDSQAFIMKVNGVDPELAEAGGDVLAGELAGVFVGVTINGIKAFKNIATGEIVSADVVLGSGAGSAANGADKAVDLAKSVKWKGFSKGELSEHFTKHKQEFGDITQNQYLKLAKDFATESNTVFREAQVGNFIIKYDDATRRVLVGQSKSREIRTFYKADLRDADPFEAAVNLAKELSGLE